MPVLQRWVTNDRVHVSCIKLPHCGRTGRGERGKIGVNIIPGGTVLVRDEQINIACCVLRGDSQQGATTRCALISRATTLKRTNTHTHCKVVRPSYASITYQPKSCAAIVIEGEDLTAIHIIITWARTVDKIVNQANTEWNRIVFVTCVGSPFGEPDWVVGAASFVHPGMYLLYVIADA